MIGNIAVGAESSAPIGVARVETITFPGGSMFRRIAFYNLMMAMLTASLIISAGASLVCHQVAGEDIMTDETAQADAGAGIIERAEAMEAVPSESSVPEETDLSLEEYLLRNDDAPLPGETIVLSGTDYASYEGDVPENRAGVGDNPAQALLTSDNTSITWKFNVKVSGNYAIKVRYYPYEGKNSAIERELRIDGRVPFREARSIKFLRVWQDDASIQTDTYGNEYRPEQIEQKRWLEQYVQARQGHYSRPTPFYLTAGEHTLTFVSVNEPMLIESITIGQSPQTRPYSEVLEDWEAKGYSDAPAIGPIRIEGEHAIFKSDPTLFPINDRTSPKTFPQDISRIKMNTIGGINWRYPGQWLEWTFDVEEEGFYVLSMRVKQDYLEGTSSYRRILIDDKLMFDELSAVKFEYGFRWMQKSVGDDEPFRIYLSGGRHTIRMENTVGEIAGILAELENTVYELNYIYRKIMMITGSFPDPNQDYRIDARLPDSMKVFEEQSRILYDIAERLFRITGSKGTDYGRLIKLAYQLESFVSNPQDIPERLDNFRQNISDQSAWILSAGEQPLLIDHLGFYPVQYPVPAGEAAWYEKIAYEIRTFLVSFVADYSNIGSISDLGEKPKEITLWMGSMAGMTGGTGRDQAQIIKTMIDNYFTPRTDILVRLKLIDMGILLPAVAAGRGPDVALSQARDLPVNYALRNAIYDLSRFDDLDSVLARFNPASYESYRIGGSLYALPETEIFHMMFYRTDILTEIGVAAPETWEDLYSIIPILHRNYMDIGLPQIDGSDMSALQMMIYQSGGAYYNESRSRAVFDSKEATEAFIEWSDLYTKYKVAIKIDALTRFRTGESPIVIQPYTFYNALAVAAPEINGLWDFTLVPGTRTADGGIVHTTVSSGSGSVIFSNAKDKESSWEFLKWWTESATQLKYGREIESLQGTSARWPTANLDAFERLPWSSKAYDVLTLQRNQTVGLPELPGSYMTDRYLGNAIKNVVNNGANPRETILDWNKKINDEIRSKRTEFGME
jgi:ABC-type glycerol-3-phosphate transport system substrate-binding protein